MIKEYRNTDGMRRWELLFEGLYLVLLNEDAPKPYSSQLLAFDGFGSLLWCLAPKTEQEYDHIANVWVKNGDLYAGSYSGFNHRLDYKTGETLETKFTK
jgi:hypothetical protein